MLPSTLYTMSPMHLQSLKLLCPAMHLQENTLFVNCPVLSTSCGVIYAPAKFEVARNIQQFRRRCIYKKIHFLTLTFKVSQNIAQFPLHHVIYASTKFEVASSNSLKEDAFTRKYILWPWGQGQSVAQYPLHHCDLCICKVWSCYIQQFRRRCIYKKKKHETSPSTLYIMWSMHLQSRPTV